MMLKFFTVVFFLILSFFNTPSTFAKPNNFVSIVNPIRGDDFWQLKNQKPEDAVAGEARVLKQYNLTSTWLLRFDALDNQNILKIIEDRGETGLFLEVTPTWTAKAGVTYHASSSWHSAGSAFLTGYEINEREKLIDAAFEKYKSIFGNYPKSVGAWWIDSYSLSYMQGKYNINSALIVADQYSTDNYQIWGQYFSTPFYPDKKNGLHPAQTLQNKLPVVISQWAPRDPVNGYGNGVLESTFSVQANDYLDYHNLGINYFKKLVDIYTKQQFNQFNSLVVGLENTYDWSKYKDEYKNQIEFLATNNDINLVTLKDFSAWYLQSFPNLSPAQAVVAEDPLGSDKKVVWFMNPYYRVGWFYNKDGSVFRDIRQYVEGDKELCLEKRCDSVNFATSATRVLDDVSFGQKWIIDPGKISEFKVVKTGEKFAIAYKNEAGNKRLIEFLPRDISLDGKLSSIDEAILNAIKNDNVSRQVVNQFPKGGFNWNISGSLLKIIKFLLFLILALLMPGVIITSKIHQEFDFKRIFLSITVGMVLLTLIFYLVNLLHLGRFANFYILVVVLSFLKLNFRFFKIRLPSFSKLNIALGLLIVTGTIFQNIPTFKSGLVFPFGMGFWGPNTHDGIWHISLINQLISSVPPQNPIFAGTVLKNYHFFYDLLVAATAFFTNLPVTDLVFRFYPVLFSLMLGLGTYYLAINLFEKNDFSKAKLVALFSVYFVYFAGSFGWIVEYLKQKTFGGESAFWANQSVSFNLNPPFAVSLIIMIAGISLLPHIKNKWVIAVQILLIGTLVAFKSYAAILILLTLAVVGVLKKDLGILFIFLISSVLSAALVLPNFDLNKQLVIFSPFWFIHSMIDSLDRVGWTRLTLTRTVGLATGNWFKFISAELIGLVLFIVGNLGMRIIGIFSLSKISTGLKDPQLMFTFVLSVLSFAIPVLIIQSGNPWNTIQFSYYGLYIAAVFAGIVIVNLISKLPKKVAFLVVGVVVLLTPINSITTASYYIGYLPHGRVDAKELEALEFLYKQPKGVVLTYPFDEKLKKSIAEPWPLFVYGSTAYVSALSGKPAFIEDLAQNDILLTDYKKRLVSSMDFFANPNQGSQFLKAGKIKYIYLPKMHQTILDESTQIKKIFENEQVLVYSIN